jgi:hypothetical protein
MDILWESCQDISGYSTGQVHDSCLEKSNHSIHRRSLNQPLYHGGDDRERGGLGIDSFQFSFTVRCMAKLHSNPPFA